MSVSSNNDQADVKMRWEWQERERRWSKTDPVREFCVRMVSVRRVYTMDLKKYV
jgi:hypothetical protein